MKPCDTMRLRFCDPALHTHGRGKKRKKERTTACLLSRTLKSQLRQTRLLLKDRLPARRSTDTVERKTGGAEGALACLDTCLQRPPPLDVVILPLLPRLCSNHLGSSKDNGTASGCATCEPTNQPAWLIHNIVIKSVRKEGEDASFCTSFKKKLLLSVGGFWTTI